MSAEMKWTQLGVILLLAVALAWLGLRTISQDARRSTLLSRLLALNLLAYGGGIAAGSFFASFFPPIFAIVAMGILTFFGLLHQPGDAQASRVEDRDLRTAITAAITTMYLALVGYGVFVVRSGDGTTDPIAQSLMTSFASVVGVVIAFYFGAGAYLEGKAIDSKAGATTGASP